MGVVIGPKTVGLSRKLGWVEVQDHRIPSLFAFVFIGWQVFQGLRPEDRTTRTAFDGATCSIRATCRGNFGLADDIAVLIQRYANDHPHLGHAGQTTGHVPVALDLASDIVDFAGAQAGTNRLLATKRCGFGRPLRTATGRCLLVQKLGNLVSIELAGLRGCGLCRFLLAIRGFLVGWLLGRLGLVRLLFRWFFGRFRLSWLLLCLLGRLRLWLWRLRTGWGAAHSAAPEFPPVPDFAAVVPAPVAALAAVSALVASLFRASE